MEIIETLKERNATLFWFGVINLFVAAILTVISFIYPIEYAETNAWHKPVKFTLSTAILVLSVGWYSGYLPPQSGITTVNVILMVTLAFEVIYITWQAGKGQASHYNETTPFYAFMFSIMASAASIATLAVGYLGIRFFTNSISQLPPYYLLAIQFGFALFIISSFQGFVMGSKLAHTVGAKDGSSGLPFLNWSLNYGDLRIAHFMGMHALQVLPLLAWYLLKNTKITFVACVLYAILVFYTLIHALRGNSLFKI